MKNKYFTMMVYVAIAFIILFVNQRWVTDELLNKFLTAISISLLTTATFSFITSKIDKQNMVYLLSGSFPFIKKSLEYGLININSSFPLNDETVRNDFINSKKVYIVMNDAKAFISNNAALFEERINKENEETNFIILDYNEKDTMNLLSRKNEHAQGYYSEKIKNAIIYHLNKYKNENNNHTVNLYLNPNYNTMAVLMMDNYAMISLYRLALGKGEVLHMTFNKDGKEYKNIRRDIEALCANKTRKFNWSEIEEWESK